MSDNPRRMARREALKWVAATVTLFPALDWNAAGTARKFPAGHSLTDPDVLHPFVPWELTLTPEELRTVTALCDVIIPADDKSPCASQVGIPDFIDEWVSAPYPIQEADRKQIRDGLAWLNGEAQKRFAKAFDALTDEQKTRICDDICFVPKAKPEHKEAGEFFARFRDLTATGFYTTKEGMKDLQYLGNTPQLAFKDPPKEVLEHLKLV